MSKAVANMIVWGLGRHSFKTTNTRAEAGYYR